MITCQLLKNTTKDPSSFCLSDISSLVCWLLHMLLSDYKMSALALEITFAVKAERSGDWVATASSILCCQGPRLFRLQQQNKIQQVA